MEGIHDEMSTRPGCVHVLSLTASSHNLVCHELDIRTIDAVIYIDIIPGLERTQSINQTPHPCTRRNNTSLSHPKPTIPRQRRKGTHSWQNRRKLPHHHSLLHVLFQIRLRRAPHSSAANSQHLIEHRPAARPRLRQVESSLLSKRMRVSDGGRRSNWHSKGLVEPSGGAERACCCIVVKATVLQEASPVKSALVVGYGRRDVAGPCCVLCESTAVRFCSRNGLGDVETLVTCLFAFVCHSDRVDVWELLWMLQDTDAIHSLNGL